jgi:hypothetical protein
LSDEDEGGEDEREDLVHDALQVEALMGWDGDPCECTCGCKRFRAGDDDGLCPECRLGDHWPADG